MSARTVAIGDIHGDLVHLLALWDHLPPLDAEDTIVFLGDYVDRGPDSAGVIRWIREVLPMLTEARVICLRGNHEDAWLRVIDSGGWPEFVLPKANGARECLASYAGSADDRMALLEGSFWPADVVAWLRALPLWYEDAHAIYVHAGVPRLSGPDGDRWAHPGEAEPKSVLLWTRANHFFRAYAGKQIVVGHTPTDLLPPELSEHTLDDPADAWVRGDVFATDTGCGKGGFLTAVMFPGRTVYESRGA
ncbi:MAG: metallophosphoesterase [Pseudomonadota bacterium]|nr:metallophosphoesterase [Pseudomonadota bacterium]